MLCWIREWVETWRVAPPFSKRRRDLLAAIADAENADAWVEVDRPCDDWCTCGACTWARPTR